MGKSMIITKVKVYTGKDYTVKGVVVYISNETTFEESEKVVTNWGIPVGGWV